jgi:hypothetical protein
MRFPARAFEEDDYLVEVAEVCKYMSCRCKLIPRSVAAHLSSYSSMALSS